jgi:penicillin-binding protein 1C
MTRLRTPALWAAAVLLFLAGGSLLVLRVWILLTPVDAQGLRAAFMPSTRVFDRNGTLLREAVNAEGERAQHVDLRGVDPVLVDAILASEDSLFRSHGGIDWIAAFRAMVTNGASGRTVSGASTITMQLARLIWAQPRTVPGKLRQAMDALRLEARLTKDEILEQYLNLAPFGPGCQGVEAASQRFLGKSSAHLGVSEAALLAGMIQAPSLYDPERHPDEARLRRNWVLRRMRETGRISPREYAAAVVEPLPAVHGVDVIKAGHFTDYVLSLTPQRSDITTTLDWHLQESVQALVTEHVRRYAPLGITNAAAVILDNASGGILAMVGSKGYLVGDTGFVNGALALRQPGSTLKPFAYALAFEKGWSPASMLADIETEYVSNDRTLYLPRNYSRTFRGPVLAKEALASSLNIPAIRLVQQVGINDFLQKLRDLGFSSLDRTADYYGLGLVLGNGEVSLLQLAGAYAALARGGDYIEPSPFPGQRTGLRVFTTEAAWLTTSILGDESMRIQAFGAHTPLLVGYPMAIKTGTSGNWRDSWTAGYTTEFTIAVWSGDFEASPMNQVSGSTGAGPLFNSIARLMGVRLGHVPTLPEAPPGIERILVCAESGDAPGPACPRRMIVAVKAGSVRKPCTMHSLVRIDARTGAPAVVSTPAAFVSTRVAYDLPAEFAVWLKDSGKYSLPPRVVAGRPTDLSITSPRPGDIYIVEPGYDRSRQSIELAALSRRKVPSVDWYVDGTLVAAAEWPYTASWVLARGTHVAVARAGDAKSLPVRFEVR